MHACILKKTCSLECVLGKYFLLEKKVICLRKAYFVELALFFFHTVIVFLIAQPIRNQLSLCDRVWKWWWWWWERVHTGYMHILKIYVWLHVCACANKSVLFYVPVLSLGIIYNSRQFYNSPFGAIYIDHTGCQAQPQNTGFFWIALICIPFNSLTFFTFFYIDTESLSPRCVVTCCLGRLCDTVYIM